MLISCRTTLTALSLVLLGPTAFAEIPIAPPGRPVPERLATVRLHLETIVNHLRPVFNGIEMRLDNYQYRGSGQGKEVQASYLQVPGEERETFDILVYQRGHVSYYINNVNLRSASVTKAPGQGVRLVFQFEGRGTEIRGHCRGAFTDCPFGSDGSAPDVNLKHIRLEMLLVPQLHPLGLTLTPADVDFTAEMSSAGGDLLALISHYKVYIRRAVKSAAVNTFGSDKRKTELADRIRALLGPRVGAIRSVRVNGDVIEVAYVPRS